HQTSPGLEQSLLLEILSDTLGHFLPRVRARLELRTAHIELESAYESLSRQTRLLNEQKEELERLSRAKDDLLSVVSHELRTPLAAIRNANAILLKHRAGPLNEAQSRFSGMIHTHVDRLTRLVDDLLDAQKFSSGTFQADLRPINLDRALRLASDDFSHVIAAQRIDLQLHLDAGDTPVHCDAGLIGRVLLNLLSNAAKFTPAGGAIRLASWREGTGVFVSVSDTGVGIAEEDLGRIFDKFVQVGDRQTPGTGLGLAICKQLIEVGHGGDIWAESTPGLGSTFIFRLPVSCGATALGARA
ncbi:MAG: sensor histidine kinase, partial [Candidatus Sericytochromatia bacterium]